VSGTVNQVHVEVGEGAVLERVRRVAGLLEVPLRERVDVHDQRAAAREVLQVRPQRRGVHRHEDVRLVPRRKDVVVGEVNLEAGDARERPGRCADLRREVRQRREVVPHHRRLGGEAAACELHAVPGVPGEADHDAVQTFDALTHLSNRYSATVGPRRRETPRRRG
jgi:hypothetical protein